MEKNISKTILNRDKHYEIVKGVTRIYNSYVGKDLTVNTLNQIEVEVIFYIDSFYYTDEDYNKEALDSIKETFYKVLYKNLKEITR